MNTGSTFLSLPLRSKRSRSSRSLLPSWTKRKNKMGYVLLENSYKTYCVKKNLLTKSSNIFNLLLSGRTRSTYRDSIDLTRITNGVPSIPFEDFLRYLEEKDVFKVPLVSIDHCSHLLELAVKFEIYPLQKLCSNAIIGKLTEANVLRIFDRHRNNSRRSTSVLKVLNECKKIISLHTHEILNSSSFLKISEESLFDILEIDNMNIRSELVTYEACQRYVRAARRTAAQRFSFGKTNFPTSVRRTTEEVKRSIENGMSWTRKVEYQEKISFSSFQEYNKFLCDCVLQELWERILRRIRFRSMPDSELKSLDCPGLPDPRGLAPGGGRLPPGWCESPREMPLERDITKLFQQYCKESNFQKIKWLLELGTDVNTTDDDDYSLLHLAVTFCPSEQTRVRLTKLLLRQGARIDAVEGCGRTALILAAERGFAEIVELLLASGANPLLEDLLGFTALGAAILKGHQNIQYALEEASQKFIQDFFS